MPEHIDPREGRHLFGLNPAGYDEARPRYPDSLYRFLVEHGALRPRCHTLEIGAGTGLATRRLIELGADPITLVEPDVRFAPSLDALAKSCTARVEIVHRAFEDLEPRDARYDLVAAATSFHWVRPAVGIPGVARLLRPGGHVALWWNVLQDLQKPDAFHEATRSILRDLPVSPTGAPDSVPFPLDRPAREADFARSDAFGPCRYFEIRWTHVLDTRGVGKLYEGFSQIQRLDADERESLLHALMRIADEQFGGRVERHVTSVLYLCRRNER